MVVTAKEIDFLRLNYIFNTCHSQNIQNGQMAHPISIRWIQGGTTWQVCPPPKGNPRSAILFLFHFIPIEIHFILFLIPILLVDFKLCNFKCNTGSKRLKFAETTLGRKTLDPVHISISCQQYVSKQNPQFSH